MTPRALARSLAEGLAAVGVQKMFGVPGGGPNLDMIGAAADVGTPDGGGRPRQKTRGHYGRFAPAAFGSIFIASKGARRPRFACCRRGFRHFAN